VLRLTRTGKIVSVVLLLAFCAVLYLLFFKPDPAPLADDNGIPLSQPIKNPPVPYKFPLSAQQAEQWQQAASSNSSKLSYCTFFSQYADSRDAKLDFVGVMAPKAIESPYFHRNSKGREYYPVYPIGPGSDGIKYALAGASKDQKNIDPCTLDAEGSPTPVVVAFPKGVSPPSGGLVRVLGYMAWQYGYINPQARNPLATVVNAGQVTGTSSQQALAPTQLKQILNIVVGRGPIVIRLSRIEFASEQTRLWVELFNTSSQTAAGWTGVSQATIQELGAPDSLKAGSTKLEQASSLDSLRIPNDLLQNTDIPPFSASGAGRTSGYITFPAVNPSKVLILNLPDPSQGSTDSGITLTLRPSSNQAP